MTQYSIDFQKFVTRHIRPKLRTPRTLAWIESLLDPLTYTIDNANAYRLQKLVELSYNGQTFALENVLNDNFDPTLRRIYILNQQLFNEVDWLISENQVADFDYFIGEVSHGTAGTSGHVASEGFLYFIGENPNLLHGTNGTSGTSYDFEIIAPSSLSSQDSQMKGYVEKYKAAARRYTILYN
ncbi:MAG: hypothetical protein JSS79_05220 [Bacteroidetes bacterium]|nr:hypothetical protein [Bacteroidota bacterium]